MKECLFLTFAHLNFGPMNLISVVQVFCFSLFPISCFLPVGSLFLTLLVSLPPPPAPRHPTGVALASPHWSPHQPLLPVVPRPFLARSPFPPWPSLASLPCAHHRHRVCLVLSALLLRLVVSIAPSRQPRNLNRNPNLTKSLPGFRQSWIGKNMIWKRIGSKSPNLKKKERIKVRRVSNSNHSGELQPYF